MPKTTSFRHMKLHVNSQIVMYVNNKPSLHTNLRDLFIYLLHNCGGSHASDIIICLNGSLRGITNHV